MNEKGNYARNLQARRLAEEEDTTESATKMPLIVLGSLEKCSKNSSKYSEKLYRVKAEKLMRN